MGFLAGEIDEETRELLREELALEGDDCRAPAWRVEDLRAGPSRRSR